MAKSLTLFFDQWPFEGGHPKIAGIWQYDSKTKEVKLDISQVQNGIYFRFPMEIKLVGKDGMTQTETIHIDSKTVKTSYKAQFEPTELILDPETWLLFEGSLLKK